MKRHMVWLTLCANPMSRKILILEIYDQKALDQSDRSIFQITICFEPFYRYLYFFAYR